jgi:hypothetical protein
MSGNVHVDLAGVTQLASRSPARQADRWLTRDGRRASATPTRSSS